MSEQQKKIDVIVIGGGVGGLSAAQYAARAGLTIHLFEEMAPGGQILTVDGLENYPGFEEPINGFELSEKFAKQAENFGAIIHYAGVSEIKQNKDHSFSVTTDDGEFTASAVIMATGAKIRELGIPGEQEYKGKGVSYCATCDGPFFKGRRILVVGGGDAACGESQFLAKLSDKIVIIHRRDRFRAQKSLADRVANNENIEIRFMHTLKEIKGDGDKITSVVLHDLENDKEYEDNFDAVFVFIGSDPRTKLVPNALIDEGGYIITDEKMATNIKGLFAIGDVRNTPFRQIVTSASDGAIAAHAASEYIDELKGQAYI